MHFTDLFIKRPVVATVVNLIILIAGYQAIRNINVRQFPRSDLSVVTVTTTYYGADADLVRELIDGHLDTIELLLAGDLNLERRGHVQYLQALVRHAETAQAQSPLAFGLGLR